MINRPTQSQSHLSLLPLVHTSLAFWARTRTQPRPFIINSRFKSFRQHILQPPENPQQTLAILVGRYPRVDGHTRVLQSNLERKRGTLLPIQPCTRLEQYPERIGEEACVMERVSTTWKMTECFGFARHSHDGVQYQRGCPEETHAMHLCDMCDVVLVGETRRTSIA